jgi:hypothetical protein
MMKLCREWLSCSCLILLALLLVGSFACTSEPYSTKEFTFPPKGSNWKYKGTLTISCSGEPEEHSRKTVAILVKDNQGKVVLDDTMRFLGARIDARVSWKKAPHFKVIIREKGTRGLDDAHNKKLLKSGGRTLSRTNYWFDSAKGKFR